MTEQPAPAARRPFLAAVALVILGGRGRIGSTVYGTILVMAALTAAYGAERHDPGKLVELVSSAVVVFWAAYVYANALSASIESGQRLSRAGVGAVADRELGIILSAIVPIAALVLGVLGVVSESTSVWLAIALGLGILTIQGYRYARVASLSRLGTAAVLLVNVALGLCIVVMKVSLLH
jgi:hypothetical protein